MPETTPTPDQFGRIRVTDKDTKTQRSIFLSELPHGNYTVLKQDASDIAGDALPPVFHESLSSESNGQTATTTEKEKAR